MKTLSLLSNFPQGGFDSQHTHSGGLEGGCALTQEGWPFIRVLGPASFHEGEHHCAVRYMERQTFFTGVGSVTL